MNRQRCEIWAQGTRGHFERKGATAEAAAAAEAEVEGAGNTIWREASMFCKGTRDSLEANAGGLSVKT